MAGLGPGKGTHIAEFLRTLDLQNWLHMDLTFSGPGKGEKSSMVTGHWTWQWLGNRGPHHNLYPWNWPLSLRLSWAPTPFMYGSGKSPPLKAVKGLGDDQAGPPETAWNLTEGKQTPSSPSRQSLTNKTWLHLQLMVCSNTHLGFKSQLHHLSWANHFTSLGLSFPTWKMKIITFFSLW